MTTRLEKAAAAWRALPEIRRGEVLRGLSCALAGGWREVWELALAAEEEPVTRRKRDKAPAKSKAVRK